MFMTKIERAIQYAVDAHAGSKRKGKDRPYILHPIEVMTIVAGLTEDEDVIAAAVLHDTVEDTHRSRWNHCSAPGSGHLSWRKARTK